MKAGTAKQLESGLKVAMASAKHGIMGTEVRQCLHTGAASASVRQFRAGTGSSRSSFHEYCCALDSILGSEAEKS